MNIVKVLKYITVVPVILEQIAKVIPDKQSRVVVAIASTISFLGGFIIEQQVPLQVSVPVDTKEDLVAADLTGQIADISESVVLPDQAIL
jgi:hypothetical protein